jgi:regulator of sigma E protease
VERREKRFETILTPSRSTQQDVAGRTLTIGFIGLHPSGGLVYERLDPLTALVEAGKRSFSRILTIFQSVWKTMAGAFSSQVTGGPIPMVQMIAPQVEQGSFSMIIFTALLSINLGVLNLLPLPFLDGGRLCFLVVELLRGRPVSLTVQRTVQWLIVALLVALMMLAVYLAFRDEIFQFLKTL